MTKRVIVASADGRCQLTLSASVELRNGNAVITVDLTHFPKSMHEGACFYPIHMDALGGEFGKLQNERAYVQITHVFQGMLYQVTGILCPRNFHPGTAFLHNTEGVMQGVINLDAIIRWVRLRRPSGATIVDPTE